MLFVDGHTEKQMIPIINYNGQKIAFAADLVPTHGHVPLAYIPGYDIRPLISLKENKMTEFLIINLKTIIYGLLCALLLYLYSNKKLKFISCWAGLTLSAWSFLHIM